MSLIDNIRVLARTVELGSFSAAARNMRLSAGVVSHRIASLEQHLGCRLFNRTTRRMQLTEQGRVFYDNCLDVLMALERAESSLANKGARPHGILNVTAPLGFGRRVVAPMLPQLQAKHPELDVFVRLSDYFVDLFAEAVDVAVRMAVLADSSLIVRKIADIDRVLCASPAYLKVHGEPKSIGDLFDHRCLMLRFPGARGVKWQLIDGGAIREISLSSHLVADDGDVLTQWALDGQGITMKPVFEVANELRSGALTPVLRDYPPTPVTLAILHAYRHMVPLKVKAFADLLIDKARAHIDEAIEGLDVTLACGRSRRRINPPRRTRIRNAKPRRRASA